MFLFCSAKPIDDISGKKIVACVVKSKYHLMLNLAQGGLMIDRFVNLIFIDSFALAINLMFGKLLRTKICNYSWDGIAGDELSTPEISANSSELPPSLEEVDITQ